MTLSDPGRLALLTYYLDRDAYRKVLGSTPCNAYKATPHTVLGPFWLSRSCQLGISPPKLENKADFHEDAQKRCEWYNPKNTTNPTCVEYWEAVLWAADYRDYVGARVAVNKNIDYIGS